MIPWHTVRSRNRKHAGVVFIMAGETFVAKTYGHQGADGEATAATIIERVNGWDALKARVAAAELALVHAQFETGHHRHD